MEVAEHAWDMPDLAKQRSQLEQSRTQENVKIVDRMIDKLDDKIAAIQGRLEFAQKEVVSVVTGDDKEMRDDQLQAIRDLAVYLNPTCAASIEALGYLYEWSTISLLKNYSDLRLEGGTPSTRTTSLLLEPDSDFVLPVPLEEIDTLRGSRAYQVIDALCEGVASGSRKPLDALARILSSPKTHQPVRSHTERAIMGTKARLITAAATTSMDANGVGHLQEIVELLLWAASATLIPLRRAERRLHPSESEGEHWVERRNAAMEVCKLARRGCELALDLLEAVMLSTELHWSIRVVAINELCTVLERRGLELTMKLTRALFPPAEEQAIAGLSEMRAAAVRGIASVLPRLPTTLRAQIEARFTQASGSQEAYELWGQIKQAAAGNTGTGAKHTGVRDYGVQQRALRA